MRSRRHILLALALVAAVLGGASAGADAAPGGPAVTAAPAIAFSRGETSDRYSIWTVQQNGKGLRRITRSCMWDWWPAWSPQRNRLAFARTCGGNFAIYVVYANGLGPRRVTPRGMNAEWPTWSPDGKRLAFIGGSDPRSELYVVGVGGNGLRRLTHDRVDDGTPAWSPDGSKILFSSARLAAGRHVLMVISPRGGRARSLGLGGGEPAWSPDGRMIAWAKAVRGAKSETDNIWIARADGRGARQLTHERVGVASHHPSWSADGRSIVFMSNRGALILGSALHVARVDGGGIHRLTRPLYEDADPDWQLP